MQNPSRKWYTATTAGAVTTLIVMAVNMIWKVSLPVGAEGALVVVISQLMAYFIPNATDTTPGQ